MLEKVSGSKLASIKRPNVDTVSLEARTKLVLEAKRARVEHPPSSERATFPAQLDKPSS